MYISVFYKISTVLFCQNKRFSCNFKVFRNVMFVKLMPECELQVHLTFHVTDASMYINSRIHSSDACTPVFKLAHPFSLCCTLQFLSCKTDSRGAAALIQKQEAKAPCVILLLWFACAGPNRLTDDHESFRTTA